MGEEEDGWGKKKVDGGSKEADGLEENNKMGKEEPDEEEPDAKKTEIGEKERD